MIRTTYALTAVALAFLVPSISAHGYVSGVVVDGQWYRANDPNWIYGPDKPDRAGWYALNQDLGYIGVTEYNDENITCHKAATPGTTSIDVQAGQSIDLQWSIWPDSHHGPVITSLARCHPDCTNASTDNLAFFTIDSKGLINGSPSPGSWASDQLIANNNTWTVTIPHDISGNFILRHEIIALHQAGDQNGADGAQNYPNCINLKISGSGNQFPCQSGADCKHGPELYQDADPGILVNIYYPALTNYTIPGPAVWSGFGSASAGAGRESNDTAGHGVSVDVK